MESAILRTGADLLLIAHRGGLRNLGLTLAWTLNSETVYNQRQEGRGGGARLWGRANPGAAAGEASTLNSETDRNQLQEGRGGGA